MRLHAFHDDPTALESPPLPLPHPLLGAHLHPAAAQDSLLSFQRDNGWGREALVQEVNCGDPRLRGVKERVAMEQDPDPWRGGFDRAGKQLSSSRWVGQHSALSGLFLIFDSL